MLKRLEVLLLVLAAACTEKKKSGPYVEPRQPCAEHDPLRKAYFGDLHSHTAFSFDAWTYDVRTTPEQAYAFAKGETIKLPPLDANGVPTTPVKLDRPLDFAAVTDHSEYLGEVSLCSTPGSPSYDSETCKDYRPPKSDYTGFGIVLPAAGRSADVCGGDGEICAEAAAPVWRRVQQAAADAYDKSSKCSFTSFVAYEYSLAPAGSNLHRNVIFRNDRVLPSPVTLYDATTPKDLWKQLKAGCLDLKNGCDVLAIPHNSNLSNGNMFFIESAGKTVEEERAEAQFRSSMEPVIEVMQHKGDSECINGLSTLPSAPDELCEYEKIQRGTLKDCGPNGTGIGGFAMISCTAATDFIRGSLKVGLSEKARIGANPYQLGFIGGTDTHNGTPGRAESQSFNGHFGNNDNTPQKLLTSSQIAARPLYTTSGSLAAVWAEENSRDSIFDAIRRRETFATSGPRISVRFFGGWNYPADLCSNPELVKEGYSGGVPMGGELTNAPAGGSPKFVVSALRDPGTPQTPSLPLQRVQIIKGWLDATGTPQEKVYDVAGDATMGAVDVNTCETTGTGFNSLCTVWSDPSFDASQHAFYYARVVETPTCRWSTRMCNSLPADKQAEYHCDNLGVPKTLQERAWASPIWYSP